MKIILTVDVENLGKAGEIITVKDGYARNYLVPRKFAEAATRKNIAAIATQMELNNVREAKKRANMEALVGRLNKLTLKFTLKAGEEGKLFGTVTTPMIADAIVAKGYPIDKKEIEVPEAINHLGSYFVNVKLGHGFGARVKIKVEAE
ncbi:MAG: 50S ribosomal protein L9 [Candidatus Marinimicrobia bacterium]|nr:50S ribosomal protein L9 [Candidatus Neomarinimicrobiota bacterium]